MKHVIVIPLAGLLLGCTAPPVATEASATGVRCQREMPTGSNIPVTTCRSLDDRQRESQAAQDAADAIARTKSGYRGPLGQ